MRKEDKALLIEKIKSTLAEYSTVYLADTAALNSERTTDLRRAAFKADIKLMVVKNTLLHKAMEQLDRSMEILCRCYYDDMRKTFHAKTYADQAIRYFRKYMNEKSIEYLEQSKRWLKEEIKNKAWAYDLKSLERKIQEAISIANMK